MNLLTRTFWDARFSRLRAGWRLVIQLLLLAACLAGFGFLAMLLGEDVPRDPLDESMSILDSGAVLLSLILSVWLAGRLFDRRRFADFGLRLNRSWWIDLAFGLTLGAFLQAGIFLTEIAAGWATVSETCWTSKAGYTFPGSILLIFFTFLGVGISEELWNRGYLLKNLAEGLNVRPFGQKGAILISAFGTAILFGLGHAANPGASAISTLALMLAGLLYATAYVLTGELAIPIGYHIAWNFFEGAVFGLPVSGFTLDTSFLLTQVQGPVLWTGGAFGPEAGLLGMFARLGGILLILVWVRLCYRKVSLRQELTRPDLLKADFTVQ